MGQKVSMYLSVRRATNQCARQMCIPNQVVKNIQNGDFSDRNNVTMVT
jgi:hypothetical protein